MNDVDIIFSISFILVQGIGTAFLLDIRQSSGQWKEQINKAKVKMEILKNDSQQGKSKAA